MFRGISSVNLDSKGRMGVPARYRANIANDAESRMIVTIDTEDSCLLLYPLPEWEKIEQKIEALPSFNRTARRIQRLLIGHATDAELDGNGRILIPPLLRSYAQLDKKVMLVGQGKKFEIWSEETWESKRDDWLADTANSGEDLPDDLQSLSL